MIALLLIAMIGAATLSAQVLTQDQQDRFRAELDERRDERGAASASAPSDRSGRDRELYFYRCSNELGQRSITLFANGTVRLKQQVGGQRTLRLAELDPEELGFFLSRLGRQDPSDGLSGQSSGNLAAGAWVEHCEIFLRLVGREEESFRFTRLDIPPLRAAHLIQIGEELAERTEEQAQRSTLPENYEPSQGDVLITSEGQRYRVLWLTSDKKAVEVETEDALLRMYVAVDALRETFTTLVRPTRGR